jgi:hypothetical protein
LAFNARLHTGRDGHEQQSVKSFLLLYIRQPIIDSMRGSIESRMVAIAPFLFFPGGYELLIVRSEKILEQKKDS